MEVWRCRFVVAYDSLEGFVRRVSCERESDAFQGVI